MCLSESYQVTADGEYGCQDNSEHFSCSVDACPSRWKKPVLSLIHGDAARLTGPVVPHQARPTGDAAHLDAGSVLRHTLAITTAETEDELVERTLSAALELTGAALVAIIDHSGGVHVDGRPDLRERLCLLDPVTRQKLRDVPAGTRTAALAGWGLPYAYTGHIGEALLVVADLRSGHPDPATAELLPLLAAQVRVCRARLRRLDRLHRDANSDPLTGLRHHRPFSDRLGAAVAGRTAVIAIDVDGFKKINDAFGHDAGDQVLIHLVDALLGALRAADDLYRIGGDEFAAVVEVEDTEEALRVADRLLLAARDVGHTVSVGVAIRAAGDDDGRATLRRADAALYEAKRAGRDSARMAAA